MPTLRVTASDGCRAIAVRRATLKASVSQTVFFSEVKGWTIDSTVSREERMDKMLDQLYT